jgi:hypothetical protein
MLADDFPIGCQVKSTVVSTSLRGTVVGYTVDMIKVRWSRFTLAEEVMGRLTQNDLPDHLTTTDGRPVTVPGILRPSELYRIGG